MNNCKICYVILHYKTCEDTIECIESLKRVLDETDRIIIVDNSPGDGSIKRVLENYKKSPEIVILQAYDNLGFAKGNNIGFKYAKMIEHADIICMFNSDTVISDNHFRVSLLDSLKNNKWSVLGIDIETINGFHQNPLRFYPENFGVIKCIYHHIGKYIRLLINKNSVNSTETVNEITDDVAYMHPLELKKNRSQSVLHGAALIFSKEYINLFNGLYPGTFMYCEEYLLKYICDRFGLKQYYDPSMKIIHKEGRSTASEHIQYRRKEMFYHKNCIYSYCALIRLYFSTKNKIKYLVNESKISNCLYKVLQGRE